jgi:hypothetical protein
MRAQLFRPNNANSVPMWLIREDYKNSYKSDNICMSDFTSEHDHFALKLDSSRMIRDSLTSRQRTIFSRKSIHFR